VRIRSLVVVVFALLSGSFTSLLADGPCGEFLTAPSTPDFDPNCVSQTWSAWLTAGQNDPRNLMSNIWGAKLFVGMLNDGLPAAKTDCQFVTYGKDGMPLYYSVLSPGVTIPNLSMGSILTQRPGGLWEIKLASPAPPGAEDLSGDRSRFIVIARTLQAYATESWLSLRSLYTVRKE
jgi:hypothetical protein